MTSNFSEGSNNTLNTTTGLSNLSIPHLVATLQSFNTRAELTIKKVITGQQTIRKENKKYLELQEGIKRSVTIYGQN